MTEHEWINLTSNNTAAVIAPAGHGKTEMLTEIVERSTGKLLLLTHTNAGVNAIKKRLNKKNISNKRYNVETIASFCIRWCNSYCSTSNLDKNLSPLVKGQSKPYYDQMYTGASKLFSNSWAGKVLKATYSRVVVDEYQDCTLDQHEIMLKISSFLPLIVLGDPLQGIFSFAGTLVDWNKINYPIVSIETYPWRWEKTNPELGRYLCNLRNIIEPFSTQRKCKINIPPNNNVVIIPKDKFNFYLLLNELNKNDSNVYITKWPRNQLEICTKMKGILQYDETQECEELFIYASYFDKLEGCKLAYKVVDFMKICSTQITKELKSYIDRLEKENTDFSRIKNHKDIGDSILQLSRNNCKEEIIHLLKTFEAKDIFKIYRKELFKEMVRSIKYAIDHNVNIEEGANHIRKDINLQNNYTQFKYLSSRTVLSKGLEFDCVIINCYDTMSVKDFYVAMTRAKKKIYIIAESDTICFEDKSIAR